MVDLTLMQNASYSSSSPQLQSSHRRDRIFRRITLASAIVVLLMFTGMQFITLGLLGEMLSRTYHESQNKPTYVIREILE